MLGLHHPLAGVQVPLRRDLRHWRGQRLRQCLWMDAVGMGHALVMMSLRLWRMLSLLCVVDPLTLIRSIGGMLVIRLRRFISCWGTMRGLRRRAAREQENVALGIFPGRSRAWEL